MDISLEKLDNIQIHFLVAQPRTGSTLLSTMFNQHSEILCIIEQPIAFFLYPKYHNIKKWTNKTISQYCNDFYLFTTKSLSMQFTDNETFENTLKKYCDDLNFDRVLRLTYLLFFPNKDKSEIKLIINKGLITYNYLNKLVKYYPASKFLFLHRRPIDTIARQFNLLSVNGRNIYTFKIALKWRYANRLTLRKSKKITQLRKIDIFYEQLILQSTKELKRILSFLKLSFEEQMVNYVDNKVDISSLYQVEKRMSEKSNPGAWLKLHEGVTKPPDPNKIGAWKQIFSYDEAGQIWNICGSCAEKIGYEKNPDIHSKRLPFIFYMITFSFSIDQMKVKLWYSSPFFVKRDLKLLKTIIKKMVIHLKKVV